MSLRTARALAAAYLVLALVCVTWPGFVPFARVRPFVLGMPFSMAWIAGWVAGTAVVLALLDRVERRHRTPSSAAGSSTHDAPARGGHA